MGAGEAEPSMSPRLSIEGFAECKSSNPVKLVTTNAVQCMQLQDETAGAQTHVIGQFESGFKLTDRQVKILSSLVGYYTDEKVTDLLLPVLQHQSPISLRALDWLVTNYSKKYNVICRTRNGGMFNIHQGYRNALVVNKRRNFDPFRRRLRITVRSGGQELESTVGQLNFMCWAKENGVVDYLLENLEHIEEDMNATTRLARLNKTLNRSPSKRAELTRPPAGRCVVYSSSAMVDT